MLKNNKSLGQHWLKDRFILDEIAELSGEDTSRLRCLEIGPGLGTLTSALLRVFPEVTSIEFDENLAKNLPKSFPGKNLIVKNADFLKFDLESFSAPYSVAGNIPYYITSPIIEKLLKTSNKPEKIVLLIQKEVAERIGKVHGKSSPLSLFVENLAEISLGSIVKKDYFTPPPKVDSEIIVLTPRKSPLVSNEVIEFARRASRMPRKKLTANLSTSEGIARSTALEWLRAASIPENARPEDLTLENWQTLEKIQKKH